MIAQGPKVEREGEIRSRAEEQLAGHGILNKPEEEGASDKLVVFTTMQEYNTNTHADR